MGRMRKIVMLALTVLIFAMAAVCVVGLLGKKEDAVQETTAPALSAETAPIVEETQPPTQPEEIGYTAVPRYFQTDYPYAKYGNGTIGTSGCSITCLAMVASYLTDQEYLPDELAYHFGSYGKNNIERLEYGSAQMQLSYEKNFDWQVTKKALKEGKVAIVMVNERSPFTTSQHFIVLTGLTEKGRVLVNDPYGPNYENPYLLEGYTNGFREGDITSGLCGAWVYDKAAMPEDPFLYDADKPQQQENRYAGYELTEEDIYLLACFAWAEARDESFEIQQAVLEVVLNRIAAEGFPNTVKGVINRDDLYHAASNMKYVEEPELEQYMAVTAAMYGPYILPADVVYYSTWAEGSDVWGEIGDYVFFRSW